MKYINYQIISSIFDNPFMLKGIESYYLLMLDQLIYKNY